MMSYKHLSIALGIFAIGVTVGILYEHQRFLKEMQSHVKSHAAAAPQAETPQAAT